MISYCGNSWMLTVAPEREAENDSVGGELPTALSNLSVAGTGGQVREATGE
jgi:hypothetical protein